MRYHLQLERYSNGKWMHKKYLQTPIYQKTGLFICKVYIHTNHTIQEYRQCQTFTDYLKNENIIIDINDLDDVNPITLGYIEHIVPQYKTVTMHTNRLNSLVPTGHPKFQLQFGSLWGKSGERARVLMIKRDEANTNVL
jgi:hypothetical protein